MEKKESKEHVMFRCCYKKWRCLNSKLMYSRERKKWLSMTEFTPCIDTTVIVQTKARESWKEKQYIVDFFVHSFGHCQRIFFVVVALSLSCSSQHCFQLKLGGVRP
jgi:hypothetical protein